MITMLASGNSLATVESNSMYPLYLMFACLQTEAPHEKRPRRTCLLSAPNLVAIAESKGVQFPC